jgi:hypothetical protein
MRLNTTRGTTVKLSDTDVGITMEKTILEIIW